MVYQPRFTELRKHIDHYWMLDITELNAFNGNFMYAYPGVTPDLFIVLEGHYTISYGDHVITSNRDMLFSFIHQKMRVDFSKLKRGILVKFQSKGISSLTPFIPMRASEIMQNPVAYAEEVFGLDFLRLKSGLLSLASSEKVAVLDQWFVERYQKEQEGFLMEMAQEVSYNFDLRDIMEMTGYSYSTLERYFKKEAGLTPKGFQTLLRFKKTLRELYSTRTTDWLHLVSKHGFYDQSHFIKEMKRFTGNTPSQLLRIPSFVEVRPE